MNGPRDFLEPTPDPAYKLAWAVRRCHELQREGQLRADTYGDAMQCTATAVLRAINEAIR